MKRIYLLLVFLVSFVFANAQYPINQNLGTDSSLVTARGALKSRLITYTYADTTAANLERIRQYAGAIIYTSGTNSMWYRNSTSTAWVEFTSSGSASVNIYNSDGTLSGTRTLTGAGNDLTFTGIGNFDMSDATSAKIGTSGSNYVYVLSDLVESLELKSPFMYFTSLPAISDTTGYNVVLVDRTTGLTKSVPSTSIGGSGSTPGIDDVLAVGQSLTANRTITTGTNTFSIESQPNAGYSATGTRFDLYSGANNHAFNLETYKDDGGGDYKYSWAYSLLEGTYHTIYSSPTDSASFDLGSEEKRSSLRWKSFFYTSPSVIGMAILTPYSQAAQNYGIWVDSLGTIRADSIPYSTAPTLDMLAYDTTNKRFYRQAIPSGGSSLFPPTGTGTATGNVAGDLDGHSLNITGGTLSLSALNINSSGNGSIYLSCGTGSGDLQIYQDDGVSNFGIFKTGGNGYGALINTSVNGISSIIVGDNINISPYGLTQISNLSNLSTQNRLIGQYDNDNSLGYITIGSGLSLSSGTLSATGGGGTPGGSNTQVQYNNSGSFGGISGATSDGTNMTFGSGNLRATSPRITTGILDANGNELFLFTATASAVNEVTFANAAAGSNPTFTASGGDTDVGFGFITKAAGTFNLRGNSTQAATIRLYEDTDDGTNYTAFKVGTQSVDITYTLPTADGSSGQFLQTNGSGTLTWATASGGVSFGTVGQIPYTNSSTDDFDYGGMTFNGTSLNVQAQSGTVSYQRLYSAGAGTYYMENSIAAGSDVSVTYNGNNYRIVKYPGKYMFTIGLSEITLNDDGSDLNIRMEGDNDANLLYLDAGVDKGSFGSATNLGSKLNVTSTSTQQAWYYDASNYFNTTVSSAGAVTFNSVGSGARFSFSDGVTLPAGTATAGTSPLKFTSGTNLTTAEAGAMEYDGTWLYFTLSGTTRRTFVFEATTQTLTNKRIVPTSTSAASASSVTPNFTTSRWYIYTALAADLTINAPTGSPSDGEPWYMYIIDDGTSRNLTWNAAYVEASVTLPASTTISKALIVSGVYVNSVYYATSVVEQN